MQNQNNVSNTLVWIAAFIPVIGMLFSFGSVVFFIINTVLTHFDEKNLQKIGYETTSLGSTWLVPVYLFRRAKMLNHSLAYFIIWCITFVISCF